MAQSGPWSGLGADEIKKAHTMNHKRATEASITLQKQLFSFPNSEFFTSSAKIVKIYSGKKVTWVVNQGGL